MVTSDTRMNLLTDLRNARLRVDRAASDAERQEALSDYDCAIDNFRRHGVAFSEPLKLLPVVSP